MPEVGALSPSDIVKAPQRHMPLVQFSVDAALSGEGTVVADLNARPA
jgi:hypothetical protein